MRPIIKWAGGKSKLVPVLKDFLPSSMETYFEPFCGGAALFFTLRQEGRFDRSVLADANEELIFGYRAVRGRREDLLKALKAHKRKDSEAHFKEVRAQKPGDLDAVDRAARFFYLNRTCFNGLWRENRKGEFNVPYGHYKNPRIVDEEGFLDAERAFISSNFFAGDFEDTVLTATPRDFVYFDPPYIPTSKTADFTSYTKTVFGRAEHERLARVMRDLGTSRIRAMVSNSDTPETREIFKDFHIHPVSAPRSISCKGDRKPAKEVVILNWRKP